MTATFLDESYRKKEGDRIDIKALCSGSKIKR